MTTPNKSYLRISHTGVRSGEYITCSPSGTQCRDTILQIRLKDQLVAYPPSEPWIKHLTDTDIRDVFNKFNFFKNINSSERMEWLMNNSTTNDDLYLDSIPDLEVKIIALGGDFVKVIPKETVDILIAGNPDDEDGYWLLQLLYNLIPAKKAGTKATHHTLIFRPNNWTLLPDKVTLASTFTGYCVDINTGTFVNGTCYGDDDNNILTVQLNNCQKYFKKSEDQLAIISQHHRQKILTFDDLLTICQNMGLNIDIMNNVRNIIGWFPPSPYKSLIQKLIRTGCDTVEFEGEFFPSKEVFATAFCCLLVHKGSFVHDIQRYVTGMESATKRLAVSICEDSYVESPEIITSLLSAAWIAQHEFDIFGRRHVWLPNEHCIRLWINAGIYAINTRQRYTYNWHKVKDCYVGEYNSYYINYFLLNTLGSFKSDILMLLSIAEHHGASNNNSNSSSCGITQQNKNVMPLYHCIDQHSFTNIAHYMGYDNMKSVGSFSTLFQKIWNEVVGINIRDHHHFSYMSSDNPFFRQVRHAQKLVWLTQSTTPQDDYESKTAQQAETSHITETNNARYEYVLSSGWLASFIGSHEIKIKEGYKYITTVIMVHPDNIHQFVVIRKPTRDQKEHVELSDKIKGYVIKAFKSKLASGIEASNVPSTLPMFKHSKIYLSNIDGHLIYSVLINEQMMSWDIAKKLVFEIPIYHANVATLSPLYHAILHTSNCAVYRADDQLNEYLSRLDINIIRRYFVYAGYASDIDIYHIGRDGDGTDYAVSIDDVGVNELLSMICVLYPAAIQKNGFKYHIKNGPLMWILNDKIYAYLSQYNTQHINGDGHSWPVPSNENRTLFEHQLDAIDSLVYSKQHGKKTDIIWYPCGSGKTSIIVNYIAHQILNNTMEKYCLYTLPPSALKTIERELSMRSIPYVHLDMRKTSAGNPKKMDTLIHKLLRPHVVNIVYHDHLRMMNLEHTKSISSDMLFVVDEFHKTLNKTKRTSVALELAHVSSRTIAMSGTLIKDSNTQELISWLKQSVRFEITEHNYFVGLASIIARKIDTGIKVNHIVVEAEFEDEQRQQYYSYVTCNLGGHSQHVNLPAALSISYEAITKKIIQQSMVYLNQNIGVFVVAKNIGHQQQLQQLFLLESIDEQDIFLIGKDNVITLTATYPPPDVRVPRVVITTGNYSEGYELTRYHVTITGVYFSNEATREQLYGRTNRLSQDKKEIIIITIHAGILSYIHQRYEKVRSLSNALKGIAKEIGIDAREMLCSMSN